MTTTYYGYNNFNEYFDACLHNEEPTFEELVIGKTLKQAEEYIDDAVYNNCMIHYFRLGEYMDTKDLRKNWKIKNVDCEDSEIFIYC